MRLMYDRIYDTIDLEVGYTHALLSHFHITSGDMSSYIYSINLAYSCGLAARLQRVAGAKDLEISSLVYCLLYVQHSERKGILQRVWNHNPSSIDKFVASLFYLCRTMTEAAGDR